MFKSVWLACCSRCSSCPTFKGYSNFHSQRTVISVVDLDSAYNMVQKPPNAFFLSYVECTRRVQYIGRSPTVVSVSELSTPTLSSLIVGIGYQVARTSGSVFYRAPTGCMLVQLPYQGTGAMRLSLIAPVPWYGTWYSGNRLQGTVFRPTLTVQKGPTYKTFGTPW